LGIEWKWNTVCAANDDAAEEDPLTLADLSDVDVDPADGEVAVLDLRRHCRLPGCLLLEDGQRSERGGSDKKGNAQQLRLCVGHLPIVPALPPGLVPKHDGTDAIGYTRMHGRQETGSHEAPRADYFVRDSRVG
jgi:hypothetical protein